MVMSATRPTNHSGRKTFRHRTAAQETRLVIEPPVEHIEPTETPATASPPSDATNNALIDNAISHIAAVQNTTSSASWAQDVFEKSLDLLDRIRYVEPGAQQQFVDLVTRAGQHIERPKSRRPLRRFGSWWFGDRIERAWALLNQAELEILSHVQPERVVWELARVRRRAATLPTSHRARKGLDETLRRHGLPSVAGESAANGTKTARRSSHAASTPSPAAPDAVCLTPHELAATHDVLASSHARTQAFQKDARAFRNRLVLTTLLALFASVLVIVMQWRLPRFDVVASPDGKVNAPGWTLMLLVMAFGSMGALLTTIPAMSQVGRVKSPYNIPIAQGCLKIVVGSLTALVGVIIIGTTSVSKGFGSVEALLGVAAAFGAAQHVVTRLLDRQAADIIERSPSRTTQPEPAP
jgi:hypothetical protein